MSEITGFIKHASFAMAEYVKFVKTPLLPAGINPPEKEKPKTVLPPVDTVKPASPARPPVPEPRLVPVISIWNPPTSTDVSIKISIESEPIKPKPKNVLPSISSGQSLILQVIDPSQHS